VLVCADGSNLIFAKGKATLPRIPARCVTNTQEFSLNGGKGLDSPKSMSSVRTNQRRINGIETT